jgi:outer membrane protein TolC
MPRYFYLFCTILSAAVAAPEPIVLTLEQALAAAEQTSLEVLIGRETVAQAVASAIRERSGMLPQVTLDATQRRSRTASVGGALVSSGINNRFDAQLNGRFELLDPERIATYKAATYAVAVAKLGQEQLREVVLATVAENYFAHLRNLRRIDVLDANITRARSLVQLAHNQLNAGVATQIDVTRAEAQLAIDEQARLQQDTVVQETELQLKQLLALDMVRPLELANVKLRRTGISADIASLEEAAFARRADLQGARKLLEQNELEVRAARYGRLPSLAAIGSYGYASAEALDGNEAKVWSGSLAMSVPVFDSARSRSLTNYALSRRRAQELRVQDLQARIAAEVRLARQNAVSRLAQIEVAEKGYRLAEQELELAERRFQQGVADNRELVEAQNRLAAASDNVVEAAYNFQRGRVELNRALGQVGAVLAEQSE